MDRQQKQAFVEELSNNLKTASLVVVTRQSGMTVSESKDLRAKMRAAGASFKVVKNTLARIAIKDTKFESLSDHLKGPAALAASEDPVAAAKVAVEYMNDNEKFQVISGVLDDKVLELADVKALAKLPSLDELRAKIVGAISAPATKLATLIKEPGAGVARVVSSYANN